MDVPVLTSAAEFAYAQARVCAVVQPLRHCRDAASPPGFPEAQGAPRPRRAAGLQRSLLPNGNSVGMPPSRGRRRLHWRFALLALAAAAAAAAGARVAADHCPALLNLTSYYPRTLLLVGPSDKVASISLQNLRFSSSSTPIRVSSAVQVQLTVRVDASCSATASHPASRRALVATISIRLQDGSRRVFRTKRSSWQWAHNGSLVDSPEWEGAPLDDPPESAGATWLTNPPRPLNRTSWATIMTTLPPGACQDADPNAVGVVESNGGTEQRRGWGTAPLATTAVLGGLLLLMSGVAAAMQTALHRLRRLDGGADDGTDGPDKSGKRKPLKTLAESMEKNAETPPGALRVSTAARHRQRPQAASHDMSSASTCHWPRADAAGPPPLMAPRGQRTPPMARYPTVLSQPPPTSVTGPSIASCHAGTCPSSSSIEAQHCQGEQGDGDNDLKRLSDLATELATGFRAPPSVPTALLSSKPPPLPAALLSPGPPPLPAVLFSPAPPPLPAVLLSPDPLSGPAVRRHPPSV